MVAITTASERICSMPSRIKIVRGATYSGKTFVIIHRLIQDCIDAANEGRPFRCRVVSETIPAVKSGALPIFEQIMAYFGLFDDKQYNATERRYKFGKTAQIVFTAYDSVGKAKQAGKWDSTFINEINHGKQQIYEELISRTDGDVYVDYNPDALFWVDTELIKHPDAEMISLTFQESECVPESKLREFSYKRELAKTSKYWANWCRVYLDGLPGSLEGVVFQDFTILSELPGDAIPVAHGIDFGWTDETAIVTRYKWGKGHIYCLRYYGNNLLTNEIAEQLRKLEPGVPIVGDSASPQVINDLQKIYGIANISGAHKPKDGETAYLNRMREGDMYVMADSLEMIQDMRAYRLVDGEYFGRHHTIDAARYTWQQKPLPSLSSV